MSVIVILPMLDTTTGKIWSQICYVPKDDGIGCDYMAWTPEEIIGINTDATKVEKNKNLINEYKKSTTTKD